MRNRPSKFSAACARLCICLCIAPFFLAMSLVKSRQNMMVIGKKISKLEKNLSSYASKNAELDAKILSLGSSKSLAEFIAEHCMVSVTARNSVKIPRGEANLNPPAYASVADNFSQTN